MLVLCDLGHKLTIDYCDLRLTHSITLFKWPIERQKKEDLCFSLLTGRKAIYIPLYSVCELRYGM